MSKLKKNILRGLFTVFTFIGGTSAFAQTATTTPGVPTTALGGDLVANIALMLLGITLVITGVVMYKRSHTTY